MNYLNRFLDNLEARVPNKYWRILAYIGLINASKMMLCSLWSMRRIFWFQKNLLSRYGAKSWVIITGGAKGLGRGYSIEFAKQGFNIFVLDDDQLANEHLAAEIAAINPAVRYKSLKVDFTKVLEDDFFDTIDMQLRDLDVSVLVNNVGREKVMGDFEKISSHTVKEVTVLNIIPQVLLTHRVISKLLARPANVRSAIINMSSMTACHPSKHWQLAASTKAFNCSFSNALYEEYNDRIDVLCVKPGFVSTPQTSYIKGWGVLEVEDVVKASLQKLGRVRCTAGHWKHGIMEPLALTETMQSIFYKQAIEYQKNQHITKVV